eukprot:3941084-Rhodomonas_salina.4
MFAKGQASGERGSRWYKTCAAWSVGAKEDTPRGFVLRSVGGYTKVVSTEEIVQQGPAQGSTKRG